MNITEEMVKAHRSASLLAGAPLGATDAAIRAGLAAAAPLIAAQALRSAADSLDRFANKYDDRTATADELHVAHGIRTSAGIARRMAQIEVAVETEAEAGRERSQA